MQPAPFQSRLALVGALVFGLSLAAAAGAAGPRRWQVAPAGPCAESLVRDPCAGGACASSPAPARSRFDPADVAARPGGGGAAPPEAEFFPGPGSCADPGTPCGRPAEPTQVAGSPPVQPPPAAPSPAGPPAVAPPPPPALPPAPPAPSPPTVVEPPVGPGTLPGLP